MDSNYPIISENGDVCTTKEVKNSVDKISEPLKIENGCLHEKESIKNGNISDHYNEVLTKTPSPNEQNQQITNQRELDMSGRRFSKNQVTSSKNSETSASNKKPFYLVSPSPTLQLSTSNDESQFSSFNF